MADSCIGASSGVASNENHRIHGALDQEGKKWTYVLTDLKTKEERQGPLPDIGPHAHLFFFLSRDGRRFGVLDASAGHHLTNRFMIFDANGKLISSLGINDILTKDEQQKIVRSTSHTSWLKSWLQSGTQSYGEYLPDENAVRLKTMADREVLVSLGDGKPVQCRK